MNILTNSEDPRRGCIYFEPIATNLDYRLELTNLTMMQIKAIELEFHDLYENLRKLEIGEST